jgi:hypothetical protein
MVEEGRILVLVHEGGGGRRADLCGTCSELCLHALAVRSMHMSHHYTTLHVSSHFPCAFTTPLHYTTTPLHQSTPTFIIACRSSNTTFCTS